MVYQKIGIVSTFFEDFYLTHKSKDQYIHRFFRRADTKTMGKIIELVFCFNTMLDIGLYLCNPMNLKTTATKITFINCLLRNVVETLDITPVILFSLSIVIHLNINRNFKPINA